MEAEDDELVGNEPKTAAKEYRECMSVDGGMALMVKYEDDDDDDDGWGAVYELSMLATLQLSLRIVVVVLQVLPVAVVEIVCMAIALQWNAVEEVEVVVAVIASAEDRLKTLLFEVDEAHFGSSRTVENRAFPFEFDRLKLFSYRGFKVLEEDLMLINEHPAAAEAEEDADEEEDGEEDDGGSLEWQTVVTTVVQSIGVLAPVGNKDDDEDVDDWLGNERGGKEAINWCKCEQSAGGPLVPATLVRAPDPFGELAQHISYPFVEGDLLSSPCGSLRTPDCKINRSSVVRFSLELVDDAIDMMIAPIVDSKADRKF